MNQSSLFGSTAPVPVPKLILRGYQSACVDKILWAMKFPDNDLIVLPTGAGKSVVIAAVADAMKARKILILQPSKEILEQNYSKLRAFMPDHLIGIYSASMKRKDINQVTFATIQSVYKYPELFQDIGLMIIDECDLKNEKKDDSMYTSFIRAINNPKTIGFTATPYRNVIGYVEEPDGFGGSVLMARTTLKLINRMKAGRDKPIFWKRLLFNINNKDLVAAGFLAPLRYESIDPIKQEEMEVNKSGSDFVLEAFEAKLSEKDESIVNHLRVAMGFHKSILVFCSSISQAKKLSRITPDIERVSDYVTGTTPADERAEIINGFRDGSIQIVFNVGVLTVGFDHPALDCIFLIRPTRSLRLYYQMAGRGVRTAPGKEYCQIYDFSNTVKQLGPIESIQMVKENRPGDRPGTYPKWEVVTDTEAGRKYWHGAALYQWVVKDIAPRRSNEPQLPSPFDRSNDLAF